MVQKHQKYILDEFFLNNSQWDLLYFKFNRAYEYTKMLKNSENKPTYLV